MAAPIGVSFAIKVDLDRLEDMGSRIRVMQGVAKALEREATRIMQWSQDEWVPIDTGFLKSTGYVMDAEWDDHGYVSVDLGYSAIYAGVVHEWPESVGQGLNKYLEWPLLLSKAGFLERVGGHVHDDFIQGGSIKQIRRAKPGGNVWGQRSYEREIL